MIPRGNEWKVLVRGLLLLGAVLAAPVHAQGCDPAMQCCRTPPPGGSPGCGDTGPAQQSSGSPGVGAGNPIDLISGNKYQKEIDLPALPGMDGLELVRHYNSAMPYRGILGTGWRLSYEARLRAGTDAVNIEQGDGSTLRFSRDPKQPDTYASADVQRGSVREVRTDNGSRHYQWHWPDGRRLSFDGFGHLTHIQRPSGEFTSLQYDRTGRLISVTDPQGRKLQLHYSAQALQVQAIETPAGRFEYRHDAQRLVAALLPGGVQRHYHYEDKDHPTLLTGISLESTGSAGRPVRQRLVTWAYDERGRATSSVKGDGKDNIERVTVQRKLTDGGGQATLTNSLGQTTQYRWQVVAGQSRLIEAKGPGCSSCAPSNVRYGYDPRGRLDEVTQLDDQGRPVYTLKHVLDDRGRLLGSSRIAYIDGRPQPERRLVRYEYEGDSPHPRLVARPSVVPDKEHVTRIAYNAAGQPTSIAEEGYSPVDAHGKPNATPISRVTGYSYSRINGRSVLTRIDGPLPNGPKGAPEDSDITQIEWDASGSFVTAGVSPMNLRTTLKRDELGRVAEAIGPGGHSERYRYGTRGELLAAARWLKDQPLEGISYRRDALGQVVEVLQQSGGSETPRSRLAYDLAGRLLWQADALGILRQAVYDTEGRLLRSIVAGAGVRQEETYDYDVQGRLQRVQDNTGAVRELLRDEAGRLVATIDPLGRSTRYEPEGDGAVRITQAANTAKPLAVRYELDETGQLQAVSAEASDGLRTSRTITHRRMVDDFGREVAVVNPDSGREVRRFDAAGRLVQTVLPDGSVADFEYDLAGRLLRRTVTPGGIPREAAKPHTVRYTYEA
ncbi:MAG: DUF6531 domain-containing protein, partial [Pseudomonadota bacterium]